MWDKVKASANAGTHSHLGTDSQRVSVGRLLSGEIAGQNYLQSANFITGEAGWKLFGDGSIEANDGYFRGDISAATGSFIDSISIGTSPNWFKVDGDGNMWSGRATLSEAKSNTFAVEKEGILYAKSVVISGTLTLESGSTSSIDLASLNVDLGSITAGNITLDTSGFIRTSGKDNYSDTTAGIFLGYDTDAHKLNIGNASKFMKWTGSALEATDIKIINSFSNIQEFTAGQALTQNNALIVGDDSADSDFVINKDHDTHSEVYITNGNQYESCQTFKTPTPFQKVHSIWIIGQLINTNGTTTASIYALDSQASNGRPTGSALTSKAIDNSTLGTDLKAHEFELATPYTLAENTYYGITLKNTGEIGHIFQWKFKNNTNPYADGERSYRIYDDGEWTGAGATTDDHACYLTYQATELGKIYKSNASEDMGQCFINNFVGMCNANAADDATVEVACSQVYRRNTGVTAGRVYYLTNTAGAIDINPGDKFKKIGLGMSDNYMFLLFGTEALFKTETFGTDEANPTVSIDVPERATKAIVKMRHYSGTSNPTYYTETVYRVGLTDTGVMDIYYIGVGDYSHRVNWNTTGAGAIEITQGGTTGTHIIAGSVYFYK